MTGLRIGLILYGGLDGLSGGYLYDRRIVEGLSRRGAEIEIVSLPWRNYGRHLSDNFSSRLFSRIRSVNWDILLQDELNHPSLFRVNRLLKKKTDTLIFPIVHHLRCSEYRNPLMNRFYRCVEKRYLKTADGFIFNSRTTAAVVTDLLAQSPPQVVAYPGKDHFQPEITPGQLSGKMRGAGPLQVLFLGNVIPRKGLHVLIEALSGLPRDSWRLTVAGDPAADPDYTGKITKMIEAGRLSGSVRFSVCPAAAEVERLFAGHHCLAMPSFYEGFGIACLEAMGFGLPVIASTAGAGPEWIRDGREGFLVPPGESGTLADRIGRWIESRRELLDMAQAALRTWREHPAWDESAERVYGFIRSRFWARA